MKRHELKNWRVGAVFLAAALLLAALVGYSLLSAPEAMPTTIVSAGQPLELLVGGSAAATAKVSATTVEWTTAQVAPSSGAATDYPYSTTYTAGSGYCQCTACCASCGTSNGVLSTPGSAGLWSGKLTLKITAKQWGADSNQDVLITVSDNKDPVVTLAASPTAITEGSSITFTAKPDEPVSGCTYTIGLSSPVAMTKTVVTSVSGCWDEEYGVGYTFSTAGTYIMSATCTDYVGRTGSGIATVTVSAPAPVPGTDCDQDYQGDCEAAGCWWLKELANADIDFISGTFSGHKCYTPCSVMHPSCEDCGSRSTCNEANRQLRALTNDGSWCYWTGSVIDPDCRYGT